MRLVARAIAKVLAVERVALLRHDLDDDGLLHLRVDDLAGHLAAEAVGLTGKRLLRLRSCGSCCHGYLASSFFAALFFFAAVFFSFAGAAPPRAPPGAAALASAFGFAAFF